MIIAIPGIVASTLDSLLYGCSDAVIGINPATDSVPAIKILLRVLDKQIRRPEIPTPSCILAHVTAQLAAG